MKFKKLLISFSVSLVIGSLGGFMLSFIALRMLYLKEFPNGDYLSQLNYMFLSEYKSLPLSLMLFGTIAVYFVFFTKKDYKTPTKEVARGINTPIAAGEGQHGSARWQTEEEKNRDYPLVTLESRDIKEILSLINEKGEQYDELYS